MRRSIYIIVLSALAIGCQPMEPRVSESELPCITVVDTDFSKGRLGLTHTICLADIEALHGHLCDGLVVGYLGLNEGVNVLFPDGVIDRTNLRVVSKSSPCLADVGMYLTGGRYQYNTFYVSNDIDGLYVVQRLDTKQTVLVTMNKGVKPPEIDVLGAKAVRQELDVCELEGLKVLEDAFTEKLFNTPPENNFTVVEINDFEWNPVLRNDYIKTDVLNKNKSQCNQ